MGMAANLAALILVGGSSVAFAAEPYIGYWANDPKDCASNSVPPLTQVGTDTVIRGDLYCPSPSFTPDGASWIVHLVCQDPMAGPGEEGDSYDYRFTIVDDKLHWDPVGEGTGSVLSRCP